MGERKGQNKYYPPDFDYKKHKSLAGYHGQHPLRERARKMHLGILIIRFEMPYNIWCEGCNKHIAMGVRYNAEKSKIGMYYTTPIYKFRMKCHLCDNHFEIKTDPANHDYVIIGGARRKEQRWDPHENEQIVPEDRATQKKLALDSMYKLEHGVTDHSRGKATASTLAEIVEHQAGHRDDYLLNQLARKRFREDKKVSNLTALQDDEIKKKFSLDLDLVAENKDDAHMAELLQYSTAESYDERQKAKRQSIEARPLFPAAQSAAASATSSSDSTSLSSGSGSEKRKIVSVARIKQISDAHRAKQRSTAFGGSSFPRGNFHRTITKTRTNLGIVSARGAKDVSEAKTSKSVNLLEDSSSMQPESCAVDQMHRHKSDVQLSGSSDAQLKCIVEQNEKDNRNIEMEKVAAADDSAGCGCTDDIGSADKIPVNKSVTNAGLEVLMSSYCSSSSDEGSS